MRNGEGRKEREGRRKVGNRKHRTKGRKEKIKEDRKKNGGGGGSF